MITTAIRLKNLLFILLAVVVLGYTGIHYADLGHLVGMRGYYTVHVDLAETGGLYTDADVTYRGVSVGRVGALHLTDDGVRADLHINSSAPPIPSTLHASVANLSGVGEEYIDLKPSAVGSPYLADGATVPEAQTSTPAPVTSVLRSVDALASSVPLDKLRTVIDEMDSVFAGHGEDLQVLLDTSSSFLKTADQQYPTGKALMTSGATVLDTQASEGDALRAFAAGTRSLSAQLDASDPDLRHLIASGPGAAQQVSALLRDVDPNLSVVLANLLTTSEVALTRQHGIQELMVQLPKVVAAGSTAINASGAHMGMALTFFDPLPCTAGYGGTTYRNGLTTSAGTLNTGARCTASAKSGTNVRGSQNAPSGGPVPNPAQPGGAPTWSPLSTAGTSTGATTMSGLLGLEAGR
ncbi:ABC transporter substrate-binding protein [Mangrovactinospora gilvigrisea]|uniref:ABC transporter substrate-binding protein n=1 Tax=Mangrovactinospora gilvigrisea TaxID=1428644 RepID=A0A1J7BBJ6_9ACTN|nr:MlaD family protein [Mangrovactinospora gilvigrisea]OIV36027.1 ABC transporter substrate-binding protein [Mangrovactinospora gilvigrisea]